MITWATLVEWCEGAGRVSAQAAMVALAIVIVQRVGRRWLSPQWRYALWVVLLLRLVTVFPIPASFSIHNAPEWAAIVVPDGPPPQALLPPAPAHSSMKAPIGVETAARSTAVSLRDGIAFCWILGVLALGGTVAFQSFCMARAVSRGTLVTDPAAVDLLESCRKVLGIRTWLPLVETDAVRMPTLMGALRPKVLLPEGLVSNVPREQLRHVLLHELAHFKRGDIWTGWLMNILLVGHWYNPLLWWARGRVLIDRECACDAAVLAALGEHNRTAYGGTMLDLAERVASRAQWAPGMAAILESGNNLDRRINMIAQYRPRTRSATFAGVMMLLLLGAVGLTDATAGDAILSAEKAEMMGRVEDFFCHNFRDISARKSLEWGEVEKADDGARSIRYLCEARIWDKETIIMNRVFTFKANGEFVASKEVEGYPKAKGTGMADTKDDETLKALVEDFFKHNFHDIDARTTIEWGATERLEDGNVAIRYKYEAQIGSAGAVVKNQRFTFSPEGKFVKVQDVEDAPKKGE